MIIDIGCGGRPKGQVNLDLFFGNDNPHTIQDIHPKSIVNFIIGDACNLPIRDKVFTMAYSSHIIEHLLEPILAIQEFRRIAKNYVIIKVPNNPIFKEHHHHYYSWSRMSLKNLLSTYFKKTDVYSSNPLGYKGRKLYRLIRRFFGERLASQLWAKYRRVEFTAICRLN